ncbi:MAG TPA: efflux RND transporter permease subunit [Leptospiraceae bacterium]|nr:efflux RND transporter permease subunit [Leptospiraceae bacterium]
MIKKIIRFSAENKFLILALTVILILSAVLSMKRIRLDAIPDLSDTQVILYTKWDRSPDLIEDQITYPIISSLLGAPKVKAIRGFSDFGYSFVYVIFQDWTDIYWARSRVQEYVSRVQSSLPAGAKLEMGPDATGVGWVYQYALLDRKNSMSPYELRALQDFKLRFLLNSIPGVAEVTSIGGYRKQYQIEVSPEAMQAYNISMNDILSKVSASNDETGARVMEIAGREFMIRGRGYVKDKSDIEKVSLGTDSKGYPVLLKNIARVSIGPEMRRGVGEFDGIGETPGAIIVMRQGENALQVISAVKEKISEIATTLPPGVEIVPVYDRSKLILSTISNLNEKLIEEILIVSFVILIFLWHFPSAVIPILTIPISAVISFIPLYIFDIGSNLMSLSGIAISIGVLVDGAIVEVENAYKKLEEWDSGGRKEDYHKVRLDALLEVGPSVFFSLLIISAAFIPVFSLTDQEGRLFKPLAYSKNLTMAIAAVLAVTMDPAFRMLFTRMEPFRFRNRFLSEAATALLVGKYYPEEKHPVSRVLFRIYEPACRYVLDHPKKIIISSVILMIFTVPVYLSLPVRFMPPLYEGSLLYMPTTLPGISVAETSRVLQIMDRKIRSFPEVETVYGKAGRAETSTDSAPFSMMETVIELKDRKHWRKREMECIRDFSVLEGICRKAPFLFRGIAYIIYPNIITKDDLISMMNDELQIPGFINAWTMPIKARIDMLSTGVRTPIGIKILGSDLQEIQRIGTEIERTLREMPETGAAFAERTNTGYFLDIRLDRDELSRYGLTVADANRIISTAVGGETISVTVEGRERYSINIRYPRELRDSPDRLKKVLVPTEKGHVPLGQIAKIEFKSGPSMIRNENGLLAGYVFVDTKETDLGGYADRARRLISEKVKLPAGYNLLWSGQYESLERMKEKMKIIVPFTLLLIGFLLRMSTGSWQKTMIILLAVPFSLVGAVSLLFILQYEISTAVWVGMIALLGLDAETGAFMLLYLDLEYEKLMKTTDSPSISQLQEAILHGSVRRVRPKIMTVMCGIAGLLPILWSSGAGSDLMKRIAAPMVGGLVTSFILELLVYPAVYLLWRRR